MLPAFSFRFVFLGLALALSLLSQSAWADNTSTNAKIRPCENDTRTLDELLKSNPPWSDKVPKGFIIEQYPVQVVTPNGAIFYNLPYQQNPNGRLYPETGDLAICQVKDSNGKLWIAFRSSDGPLGYVQATDVETKEKYNSEAKKEIDDWNQSHQGDAK